MNMELPIQVFDCPPRGARVAPHAATDEWMQGDRYGEVIGFTRLRECREYGKPATYRVKVVFVKTPTPSEIKYAVQNSPHESHFFDRKTMQFFGDTVRNFGTFTDKQGRVILYRKRPVKHRLTGGWVFDPVALTLRRAEDV
jgi:hypothetical protein